MMRAAWIFAILFFSACTTSQAPVEKQTVEQAKPVTPVTLAWAGKMTDADKLTAYLLELVSISNLSSVSAKDAQAICPKFAKLSQQGKEEVFAQLISKMAQRESGFKTQAKYQESFKDAQGKPVISRGLLQISIESARSYGCDLPKGAESLHDPNKNLACGVKIIARWVERDGFVMGTQGKNLGCGRYWSVCRASSKSYSVIRDYMKALALCK